VPNVPPLVLVKSGDHGVPGFFLVHGMGGTALDTFPIGTRIRWPGNIYSVQGRGLDPSTSPDDRIEDMAQAAADAIIQHQPAGPYYLAGISWGGMVMLEAALRLIENGQRVALLAFLDTYPHPRLWPIRCWLGVAFRRTWRHLAALMRLRFGEMVSQLALLPVKAANSLRYRTGAPVRLESFRPLPPALGQARAAYALAVARYRPRPFPAPIIFIEAGRHGPFPTDPAFVWGRLGQRLELHRIPCEHGEMFTTHAGETADCLSRCLERA